MSGEIVWTGICNIDPNQPSETPLSCKWIAVETSVFDSTGPSKEQYDQLFGAVMLVVVTIIIIALIKRAIEQ